MNDSDDAFLERMRALIGRDCLYYGRGCRIVDILTVDGHLVLETRDGPPPIQTDQYGQAAFRANEHIEVPLFGADEDLSVDLLHLLDGLKK